MRYPEIPNKLDGEDPRAWIVDEVDEFLDCKQCHFEFADKIIDRYKKTKTLTYSEYNALVKFYYEHGIETWRTDSPSSQL